MTRVLMSGLALAGVLSACATPPNCEAVSGFELGRGGEGSPAACDGQEYAEAWRLGQTRGTLESEVRTLEVLDSPTAAQRQRLRVLQREIPELETLARLQGVLPTRTVSDQQE